MKKLFSTCAALIILFNANFTYAKPSVDDDAFWNKIAEYGNAKDEKQKEALKKEIWDTYGVTKAIAVVDTSGFTARSIKEGILSTLVVINELSEIVTKDMETAHGKIIKFDADDAFLLFDTPEDAISTLNKVKVDLEKSHINQGDGSTITISAGIGYGPVLLLKKDAFSQVLNITSKLGEDTAGSNEILLTEDAYNALKKPIKVEAKTIKTSDIAIKYYVITN